MYRIRREKNDDWWAVEALFDLAFVPGRTALSSYRLRDGVEPVADLCLVAEDEAGVIAGAVRHWPVRVDGQPALLLGPIAVHPTRQGEGLGALLMGEALTRARGLGWARVLLIGDHAYYRRFGFERTTGIEMPRPTNPDRILARPLAPGGMEGVKGKVSRDA